MKLTGLVFLAVASLSGFAQTRIISHVTRAGGGFQTNVVAINTDAEARDYTLTAYASDGTVLPVVRGNLQPGQKLDASASALFGTGGVSHFRIEGSDLVRVSVAYVALTANASPAHVTEGSVQSQKWIIIPGNWQQTWDGMAVVNTGAAPATVTVNSVDASGAVIASSVLETELAPMAKTLSVLSTDFSDNSGGYFEILGSEPLAITALRGNLASTLLWQNTALSAPFNPQGCIWQLEESGLGQGITGLVWTGSMFAAVSGSTILTSPDGRVWSASASGTSDFLIGMARGETTLLALGNDGAVLTSEDGVNWIPRDSGTAAILLAATWDGSLFYACGQFGTVLTSADGVAWTREQTNTLGFLMDITWNGERFAAVGEAGLILTSDDGAVWTMRDSGTTDFLRGITWSGEGFVAVGDNGAILTSVDGESWSNRAAGTATVLRSVIWDGNRFLVTGNSGTILESNDGNAWRQITSCTTETLRDMVWNGDLYVAVGDAGTILTRGEI